MTINTASLSSCTAEETKDAARVVVIGLASCFGCQVQITNIERHLTDLLGRIDLRYWQLVSSDPMPECFDIAIVEGAATTEEALETLRRIRAHTGIVIAIGSCATTGGIPAIAAGDIDAAAADVYEDLPEACGSAVAPRAVSDVIDVDYEVRCCPIDPFDLLAVLEQVLHGSNRKPHTSTLCGECKRNERGCFYGRSIMCLGMVTRSGCGARCPDRGRPCNGCAGVSPQANLESARAICRESGIDPDRFDAAMEMFNRNDEILRRG